MIGAPEKKMESNELLLMVARMVALLEEIADNTKPELIDEKTSAIKGFKAEKPQ